MRYFLGWIWRSKHAVTILILLEKFATDATSMISISTWSTHNQNLALSQDHRVDGGPRPPALRSAL